MPFTVLYSNDIRTLDTNPLFDISFAKSSPVQEVAF